MDWDALVTNPIHTIFGGAATLILDDSAGTEITLTDAIDETKGVAVGDDVEVQTIEPAVLVKRTDLADVDLADLRGATLSLNGTDWTVRSHKKLQTPGGADTGNVRLILKRPA